MRLCRSRDDAKLLGVCGGLGQYFGVDATLVRLLLAIGSLVGGVLPGIVLYLLYSVVVPREV